MNGRRLLVGFVACAVALVAAGCTSTPLATTTGHDGGHELTVPALWADTARGVGGIEPAVVWAGTIGPPGFGIDLTTIQAQGAGKAWTAASASAAAVATLLSGLDPAQVDIDFRISGPIDGPSAGAILTVGALAALRGVQLKPGVTMSGSISPDGSIGPVGGIDLKIKAAADAGYETVLLPMPNMPGGRAASSERMSPQELGAKLGVTVEPVATIDQAYAAFTGTELAPAGRGNYSLPAAVQSVAHLKAKEMIERASAAVMSAWAAGSGSPERSDVVRQVESATKALDAGDDATAYGMSADSYLRAVRAAAEQRVTARIEASGLPAVRDEMGTEIEAGLGEARAAIVAGAATGSLGLEQQLSVPAALGWATYAEATLGGLRVSMPVEADEDTVILVARILAEQRARIDVFLPDALAVVEAMPRRESMPSGQTVEFLSQYTNFLVRAGDANSAYVAQLLLDGHQPSEVAARTAVDSLVPVVAELGARAKRIPAERQVLALEVEQSSEAMAYFIASASLIASEQAFGMAGFGIGGDVDHAGSPEAVRASIDVGLTGVESGASRLADRGLDAGYSMWSAQWGAAAERALGARGRSLAGATLALNEIWFSSVTVSIIDAGLAR